MVNPELAKADLPALTHAAKRGDGEAAYTLVLALNAQSRGSEGERAAELGVAEAAYDLAAVLIERGRMKEAEPWLRRSAEAGNDVAASILAMLLIEAMPLADRALAGGRRLRPRRWDAEGVNNYAVLLHRRNADLREVLRWLKVAADGGIPDAALNLRKLSAGPM